MKAVLGRKLGMTQVFAKDGKVVDLFKSKKLKYFV